MKYSNSLKYYRKKNGLTQQDVANALGLASTNRLSVWESGISLPSAPNLLKLASLYNISPKKLYEYRVARIKKPKKIIKQIQQKEFSNYQADEDELIKRLAEILVEGFLELHTDTVIDFREK